MHGPIQNDPVDHNDIRCVLVGFHIETVPLQCTTGWGRLPEA